MEEIPSSAFRLLSCWLIDLFKNLNDNNIIYLALYAITISLVDSWSDENVYELIYLEFSYVPTSLWLTWKYWDISLTALYCIFQSIAILCLLDNSYVQLKGQTENSNLLGQVIYIRLLLLIKSYIWSSSIK